LRCRSLDQPGVGDVRDQFQADRGAVAIDHAGRLIVDGEVAIANFAAPMILLFTLVNVNPLPPVMSL
jgi:hypothetical protein